MASILHQLAAIVLIAIAIQTFVLAEYTQQYDDYEENEFPNIRKFLNILNMLNPRPKWYTPEATVEFDDSSDEEAYDDERDARSHNFDMEEHFCMMVTKQQHLSSEMYEFRPSILEEKFCQPVIGVPNHNQKGICYVRGRGCQTIVKEISIFKRQRHANNCWQPEIRNISDGCRCYFERHSLREKTYTG